MNAFERFFSDFFEDYDLRMRPFLLTSGPSGASPSASGAMTVGDPLRRSSVGRIRTDFVEKPESFEMTAELPGIPKEVVKVTHEGNILHLEAEKKYEKKDEDEHSIFTERSYGSYQRSIRVPDNCNLDEGKALFENGILKLTFPKKEPSTRKTIEL